MIAWLPPTAIAAGSNDSVSGRQWTSPCRPGTSSGKQPVDVVARAHEQDLQLGALEEVARELAERHELMDGLDPAAGDVEQRLERIGRAPAAAGR